MDEAPPSIDALEMKHEDPQQNGLLPDTIVPPLSMPEQQPMPLQSPAPALDLPVAGMPALTPEAGPSAGLDVPIGGGAEEEARAADVLRRIEEMGAKVFFEKALTASDASGSGRVVVPKAIAEQYFPRLETANGIPVSAVDIDGRTYNFKWRFWINNQSRMYLLEGAGELHGNYNMSVGDVMVFAQNPADQSLIVAGRPATKSDTFKKAPPKRTPAPGGAQLPRSRDRPPKPPRSAGQFGDRPGQQKRRRSEPAFGFPLGGRGGVGRPQGRYLVAGIDVDAPVDGIFRAVLQAYTPTPVLGVSEQAKHNRWVATVECAGELYQAFFDTHDDALEACRATGMAI